MRWEAHLGLSCCEDRNPGGFGVAFGSDLGRRAKWEMGNSATPQRVSSVRRDGAAGARGGEPQLGQ